MKLLQSIEKILKDLEIKGNNISLKLRIFGSVLVILSGVILFSDKIVNISLENNFGFKSTKTFIWVLTQSLSPLLIAFATVLRPYVSSYLVPIYIYFIQVYWVFKPSIRFDDYLLQTYAIGTCLIFVGLIYIFNRGKSIKLQQKRENEEFINETKKAIDLLKNRILKDA